MNLNGETYNIKPTHCKDYPYLQGEVGNLFEQLRKRIMNLKMPQSTKSYRKNYIAFKLIDNFVSISPQGKRLRVALYVKFGEIDDPKGMCEDRLSNGRHVGNANIGIDFSTLDQLDDVMYLVRQSFDRHWEEDDA